MAATSDIIQLNVGGVQYMTSRSTLVKYPDSMLAAMFRRSDGEGGEIPPGKLTKDGSYFIDRNGAMFHYVLSFLRNDTLICPTNWGVNEYRVLIAEADFYQIGAMVQRLEAHIRKKILEMKYDQDEFPLLRHDSGMSRDVELSMFGTYETLQKLLVKKEMSKLPTGEDRDSKYLGVFISDVTRCNQIIKMVPKLGFFLTSQSGSTAKYCKVTNALEKKIMKRKVNEKFDEDMSRMFEKY